jgi:hypothetical protein
MAQLLVDRVINEWRIDEIESLFSQEAARRAAGNCQLGLS